MSDLERRLLKVIARQLRVDENSISREAVFASDLGADSLATVEIIMSLEDEFDIQIPDEHAESIVSVRKALEYVAHAVGGKGACAGL